MKISSMIKILNNEKWETIPKSHLKLGADTYAYQCGIYETFRTLNHKPVFFEPHLDRLFKSANQAGIKIIFNRKKIIEMVKTVISDIPNPNQRTTILAIPNNIIVYTSKLKLDKSVYSGVKVATIYLDRMRPEVKTTNSKNKCSTALKKAKDMNCFEAILIDKNNIVLEGSRSNVFWIKNKSLKTRKKRVLPGITRQTLISRSPYPVLFDLLNQSDLKDVDELFITNSSYGIIPITKVDSFNIRNTRPGPITKQLLMLYDQWINENN